MLGPFMMSCFPLVACNDGMGYGFDWCKFLSPMNRIGPTELTKHFAAQRVRIPTVSEDDDIVQSYVRLGDGSAPRIDL